MSKIDPEKEYQIAEMLRDGASYRAVMDQVGVSATVVSRVKAGLANPPRLKVFDPEATAGVPTSFPDIIKQLRRRPMTLVEIALAAKVEASDATRWIAQQQARGVNLFHIDGFYSVERQTPIGLDDAPMLEVVSDAHDGFTFGACGDNHMGSKYERMDILHDLYDQFADEGASHVFNTGNYIDGEARFNKFDLHTHGMDGQLSYLAREYPRRPGLRTYAVSGDDHEGWYEQQVGINIGKHAEAVMRDNDRDDWHHLGFMESYVKLVNARSGKSSVLLVLHPGGGTPYAVSYTMQKLVESFSGGDKPAVIFAGHYHKMELVNIRNVFCVQTGCTQDQTPFMRKKKIEAHMGGHTIRLKQDPRTGAIVEMNGMKRYFNRGYCNDRYSHGGPVNLPRAVQGGAA